MCRYPAADSCCVGAFGGWVAGCWSNQIVKLSTKKQNDEYSLGSSTGRCWPVWLNADSTKRKAAIEVLNSQRFLIRISLFTRNRTALLKQTTSSSRSVPPD